MSTTRQPARADVLIELSLALLALAAFVLVTFAGRARLLSSVIAFTLDALGGRGRLLSLLLVTAFGLLALRAGRNRRLAPAPRPGPRPGAWLCRLRPPELALAGTFLVLLFVFSEHGGRLEVDGPLLFIQVRSAVIDHDLDFTNEFAEFVPERYQFWAEGARQLGKSPDPAVEPGPAIFWAPFFLLAHGLVLAARLAGAPFAADGYGAPYINAVCLGSLVWAFVGVVLTHRIARRFFPPLLAAACAAGAWLASPLLWYSVFEPAMAHAPASAAVAAFLWQWLRLREDPTSRRRWLLLALAGGIVVSMQRYDVYFLLAPALTALALLRRRARGIDRHALRGLLATAGALLLVFGLTVLPFVYTNLASRHASILGVTNLGSALGNWAHPHLGELLFSSRNGLLSWTPVAYLGVVGLLLLARRDRGLAATLLLTLGFGVYLLAASYSWGGGWSFGSRRLTEAFPLFVLGLCAVATYLLAHPAVLGLLSLGGLAAWNLLLADQVRRREIPRDDTFSFSEAAARGIRRAYEKTGHLPSVPAPWIFASWYGVSPDRFDLIWGREPQPSVVILMGTPSDEPFRGRGWSVAESGPDGSSFRWSEGPVSSLLLSLAGPRDYLLSVRGEPGRHPAGLLQTVAVEVNGRRAGVLTLGRTLQTQTLDIAAAFWRPGLNELRFVYAWTVEAGTAYGGSDPRRIAWRVEELALRPAGPPD